MRFPGLLIATLFAGLCAIGCREQTNAAAYGQTLDLKIDPPTLESGSSAQIIAEVKEAMMPKAGVKVTFSASGNCGSLSGSSSTTQSGQSIGFAGDGQAVVTYRGNSPYSTCSAIITATAKTSATSMVTVTPKALVRTAPDSSVPAGEDAPSVAVTPDVTLPVSNGYSATYSITATNADIDQIRIQTTQRASFSTSNGATPPEGAEPNPKDATLLEPVASNYDSDVVTITSDSLRLGRLIMTVTLKNPFGGQPIVLRFVDPTTKEGVLPGPG